MKSTEIKRLVTAYLLPSLPGYRVRGSLLYAEPVEALLRGFLFETSGSDRTAFYVWAFVQPLDAPAPDIPLTFGERLGGGSKVWRLTDEPEGQAMGHPERHPVLTPILQAAKLTCNRLQ